ncbi:MAG TPA: hypothetical protein VFT55_11720, partial [Planctomycetota bacterium]|nr:hypothetical protein [Planctomycetota bacterium]
FVELLGDRDSARDAIERAEALAASALDPMGAPDVRAFWTVANAWHGLLEDPARARGALDTGLSRATDVSGCLTMAAAWSSHEREPSLHAADIQRCLAKARGFARSFADWFAIAEQTRDCAGDADDVRSALQQARAVAATPEERRQLGTALRRWLGDHEAASALGSSGLTPDELAPPGPPVLGWPRDAGALFHWLRARITEDMLDTIAGADYGNDHDEHLAALVDIWRDGLVPVPLFWHPRDVLELRQWEEGLGVDHVERAFCCTLLCFGELEDEPLGPGGIEDTLATLLESCMLLGHEALVRLPGLLSALLDPAAERDTTEAAFCVLALLLVTAQLDGRDPRLEAMAARLRALDVELAELSHPHPEHGFVLGATFFDQRVRTWQRLVRETLARVPFDATTPALAEVVRRFAGA